MAGGQHMLLRHFLPRQNNAMLRQNMAQQGIIFKFKISARTTSDNDKENYKLHQSAATLRSRLFRLLAGFQIVGRALIVEIFYIDIIIHLLRIPCRHCPRIENPHGRSLGDNNRRRLTRHLGEIAAHSRCGNLQAPEHTLLR